MRRPTQPMEMSIVTPAMPEPELRVPPPAALKSARTPAAASPLRPGPPLPPALPAYRSATNPVLPDTERQKAQTAAPASPAHPVDASLRGNESAPVKGAGAQKSEAATAVISGTQANSRSVPAAGSGTGPVVGPSYDAGYLRNPAPLYPAIARRLKLQGTAVVRVFVSSEGEPKSVALEKTSGARVLDDAALEAVRHWVFVPARRGNERIAAWVDVPLRFRLN